MNDSFLKEIKILIVEDSKTERDLLINAVNKYFPNIYEATNGKEALEIYEQNSIDIIISDINMPYTDIAREYLLREGLKPELIILDEPTTGLDPISLIRLKEIIKAEKDKGKTILITSHIMSFVEEISDEIVFLLDGKIYFKGSINQLKEQTNQNDLEHAIANILTTHHA